jgi:LPS sulfotransferase NodH
LRERKDLRIIHLKRRNLLATLVSWKLAHQTQRWQRRDHGRLAHDDSVYRDITIKLTYEECREEFAQTERWQQFYDAAFGQHRFLEMHYEDLVADRRREMRRVLEFLKLENRELQSPLRKQNPRTLEEVVENFAELRRRFANTRYADFFTETAG